jgi:hypothetical protein
VLPRNNEWEYAREFINVSPVLDDERRDAFIQALDTLREEQAEADRREEEERARREEAIRRDIEEARRLRAENEAREKKRLEEERMKREAEEKERKERARAATEGDFGVERTPTPPVLKGGMSASSRSKPPGSQSSTGSGGVAKRRAPVPRRPNAAGSSSGAVVTPTLMSRASMVLDNLWVLVDEIAGAFRTNPYVLLRMLAFVVGLLMLLSRKKIRERIARILGASWGKVKATAGMGTKVSYI